MVSRKNNFIILVLLALSGAISAENWHGAELRSVDSFLYGRFEVRFKPANGDGLVASFFTYNDLNPTTPWNEIDLEILGRYDDVLDFVTITSGQNIHKHNQLVAFDPHVHFHTYVIEWTPDQVTWFVDGIEFTQDQPHVATLTEPQKIMMNIWLPAFEDWVGVWDERSLPRFSYYDYVSYASYTPDSGSIGTDSSFTPQWTDEFNQFDSTRWEKSHNHTWAGNQVTMVQENIVYDNGNMVLCLTTDNANGMVDNEPPAILWARAATDAVTVRFTEEVDSTIASTTGTYLTASGTVLSADLQPDRRTVNLDVPGFDLNATSNLMVLGIQDDADPPNSETVIAATIINPSPLTFPLKINVGGASSGDYLGDQDWSINREYGRQDGSATTVTQVIANTDLQDVYNTSANRLVYYRVRVPSGTYSLQLQFSENYYDESGKRVFDIYCNDSLIVSDLDIFSQAGQYAAFNLTVDSLTVNEGSINLFFSSSEFGDGLYEWRGGTLNGLVIEQLGVMETDDRDTAPIKFGLGQNYPNPFNQSTSINFYVGQTAPVTLDIYNLRGQLVRRLVDSVLQAGSQSVKWNGLDDSNRPVSSGVYLYQMKSNALQQQRKLLYLK